MNINKTMAFLLVFVLAGCTAQMPAQSPAYPMSPPAASVPDMPQQVAKDTKAPLFDFCYVNAENVIIRTQADEDAGVLCRLPFGLKLEKLESRGEWTKVRYDEIEGYISSDLLSVTPLTTKLPKPRALMDPAIVVKKEQRVLELWDGDALVAVFPVGLGFSPEGHKQIEGDGRTPEGDYYVCMRNKNSRYYLSLGLSYPNKNDAKAALEDGRIDQRTYDKIAKAIDAMQRPSWSTPLGGEIMIHGHGAHSDWTLGCVALDDEAMDILWAACKEGTPVTILP